MMIGWWFGILFGGRLVCFLVMWWLMKLDRMNSRGVVSIDSVMISRNFCVSGCGRMVSDMV